MLASHAFAFAGASPNHSATAAFASGLRMWFEPHVRAVRMLAASELIIHVSDQPVAPSSGTVDFDRLALGLEEQLTDTCQVVPTVVSPLANAEISLV